MKHISRIIKRVMQSIKVEEKADPDAECWECGKSGDYYDGVCFECASRPFGLLWQLEQPGRSRLPTREELETRQAELEQEGK